MANYLSKMKMGTIRDMARKMVATPSGHKVTSRSFNKFLKEHKDLHHIAYGSKGSALQKYKATKVFGQIAKKVSQSDKFRLSYFAKKMGVKASAGAGPNKVTMERVYKKAAQEEIASSAKPTGPSREETEKQQRRQAALKTLHKRERADEMRQEESTKGKETASPARSKPVQIAQGGTSSLAAQSTLTDKKASVSQFKSSSGSEAPLPSLAILPLSNPKRSLNASWLVNKLDNCLFRIVKGLKLFKLEEPLSVKSWLSNSGWEEGDVINLALARAIGREAGMDFVMMGEWQKDGMDILVAIQLINIKENKITKLAQVKEKEENLFGLENRISWELHNFFADKKLSSGQENKKEEPEIPSSQDAEDLPI